MHPRVSVIIVSWNGRPLLERYLPSVAATLPEWAELILADNHSTDGSIQWTQEAFPECRIVSLDHNYGYCGGNNRAAREAKGDILLFLNNDVKPASGWLEPLLDAFDREPELAAAQPKLRSVNEPELFEYAGAAGGFLDRYGYPYCRGRVFHEIEKDHGQYDEPMDLFWATGAALAVRASLFRELGGFDERFEFHMEEIDLCWRLRRGGHRIRCIPESVVYHLGGGSLAMDDPRKAYYNFRNSLYMIWKNASPGWLWRRLVVRLLLDGVAGMEALLRGRFARSWAIFRAHMAFYRALPALHRHRKQETAWGAQWDDPPTLGNPFLIREFYLRGRRTWSELHPEERARS
ncbi:MAG: glycosyltransferase family 2 protein [Balneolaceae bacterium]